MDEALADSFFLDVTGRTAKHLLERTFPVLFRKGVQRQRLQAESASGPHHFPHRASAPRMSMTMLTA